MKATRTIDLTVRERIMMINILPSRGSYDDLISAIDIRKQTVFNDEETAKYDVCQGYLTTVSCEDCNSVLPSLEPPNALDGRYECQNCGSFNTSAKQETGRMQVTFNEEVAGDDTKPIGFSTHGLKMVSESLKKTSERGLLTEQFLSLYEKFVN